ncbi:alkaline phosphatase D family protein [Dactylosporangium siamense]|uniref:Alkaline phosphatase n=1 Tax=Dactylosporangium siamense TaxID=685454 RepID=A0A919PIP4_9ACTN|nr:alkaline phosphatase D family protein [Dactylosporangium siamense]GIG45526.1 alkaline phosphatase [Dactylosporangium siamense]
MGLDRRTLLRAAISAGAFSAAWPLTRGPGEAYAAAAALGATWDAAPFTVGVASGDPLPTSVLLWTRLAPDPLGDTQPLPDIVQVDWAVATDATMGTVVASGSLAASVLLGHSVHVIAEGLQPGRRYWYRFSALGRTSRVGRTKTAPVGAVSQVRFASLNCQDYRAGEYPGMRDLAADSALDFVVHLGDYIYEGSELGTAYTLTDYRKLHALYKGDALLRDLHAAHPFYLTWDDHDVFNDYSGSRGAATFVARRAAAYQGWYEHMPLRLEAGDDSALPDPRIYRSRQWGDLLELVILDLRQHRSEQNLADGTILGARQKTWLKDRIAQRGNGWQCWINSIFLSQQRAPQGGFMFTDQWDGFRAERAELLAHVHTAGGPDFVTVTGDWHSAFIQDVKPDFDTAGAPVIGTEFVAHSVSSSAYSASWNATNGPLLGAANPHLQYFEGNRYGHDVYEVTPQRWTTRLRVVSSRTDPSAAVSTLTSWHVDRGRAGAYEDPATRTSAAQYRR